MPALSLDARTSVIASDNITSIISRQKEQRESVKLAASDSRLSSMTENMTQAAVHAFHARQRRLQENISE